MSKTHKKQRATANPKSTGSILAAVTLGGMVLLIVLAMSPLYLRKSSRSASAAPRSAAAVAVLEGKVVFRDVAAQSREFLAYYSTIHLTPQQEAIKREVLEAMPAACCKDSTAYTCCCTCNLSKTIWGLSNYVIATHHANADQLREVVTAWKSYTNPAGYSGSSCYDGRCELPYHENGCGGMSESNLVL